MIKTCIYSVAVIAGALALASCESGPAETSTTPTQAVQEEPIRLTDVPTPPGIAPQALQPFTGDAQTRAQLSLDQVIDAASLPDYLAQPAATTTPTSPDQPPLAAQKFYAEGRQALLEGDNFRAIQQFEKSLRLSPNEPEILRSLGEAWTRAGNRVSATNQFRRAYLADPTDFDSLLMLGRFASEDRNWELATLNLNAALQRVAPSPDAQTNDQPDLKPDPIAAQVIRFYLSNALNQAGHARAAVQMYQNYLDVDAGNTLASRYGRELMIIDAQQGETLTLIGDLYHRLDNPIQARNAYVQAARVGVLNPDALRRRLLYTYLRLGQPRAAEQLVAKAVAEGQGDQRALELIPYAAAQGLPISGLTERLTEQYESQGRPASLALAMADVLPKAQATELLRNHLAERPGDEAVFGRLIQLLVASPAEPAAVQDAITITAHAMAGSPEFAQSYADQLIAHADPSVDVLAQFPPADPNASPSQTAALETLRGQALIVNGETLPAAEAFDRALALDPQQKLARTALAELRLNQGKTQAAATLLEPLADSLDSRSVRLRIRALTQAGRNEEALKLIDDVLQRTPQGSPLMLDKAALQVELGQPLDAERTLLDALNARPTDEKIYEALLQIYNNDGSMIRNYTRLIRRMVETIPNARITKLVKIEHLLANRKYSDAEQLLQTIKSDDDVRVTLQRMQLEIDIHGNRVDAVTQLIDQHIAEAGDQADDEMLRMAVDFFYHQDDRDKAFELEEYRWQIKPPSVLRSQGLARAYLLHGEFQKASETAREALDSQLAGDRAGSLIILLVQSESAQNNHAEAARIAQEALDAGQADRQSDPLTSLLIENLFKLKRYEEVVELSRQAIETSPDSPTHGSNLYSLVNSLCALDRFDEAQQVIDEETERTPERGAGLGLLLAGAYEDAGQGERALATLEATLKQHPNDATLNNHLGYSLANQGIRLQEAQRMIARALSQHPQEAAYLDSMGWVYYKMGQFEQALRWLERGRAARGGDHVVIVDHTGDTLYRLGRIDQAIETWRQVQTRLAEPGYVPLDPEENGLADRVKNKILAAQEDRPAPVAELGEPPEPDAADAPDQPAADPPAAPDPIEM